MVSVVSFVTAAEGTIGKMAEDQSKFRCVGFLAGKTKTNPTFSFSGRTCEVCPKYRKQPYVPLCENCIQFIRRKMTRPAKFYKDCVGNCWKTKEMMKSGDTTGPRKERYCAGCRDFAIKVGRICILSLQPEHSGHCYENSWENLFDLNWFLFLFRKS